MRITNKTHFNRYFNKQVIVCAHIFLFVSLFLNLLFPKFGYINTLNRTTCCGSIHEIE